MLIPKEIPGLKGWVVILGIYSAVWISLEGRLWQVVVMSVGVTAVGTGFIWQKRWGGNKVKGWHWVGLLALTGLMMGLLTGSLTLIFMSLKTGLHTHGPEFTAAQIVWIIRQIPLWSVVGLSAGLGIGLLTKKIDQSK